MKASNLRSILDYYLSHCDWQIRTRGNLNMRFAGFQDYLNHLTDFDCPDAYAKVGDSVCIIEHFEFDSTESSTKGSASRKELARIDRRFATTQPSDTPHDTLQVHHDAKDYIGNALKNMKRHYERIDAYIDHLGKAGIVTATSKIEVGFFIEDTTVLGNTIEPDNWEPPIPVILAQCKQFLDLFEDSPRLDFCLCASVSGSSHHLWFINRESIPDYRIHQIDMLTTRIIDFSPQVLGVRIPIPPSFQ